MVQLHTASDLTLEDYLQETLSRFLGLAPSQGYLIPPLPEHLRQLLLRHEEYEHPHRDQWGNWEHPYAANYERQMLWVPEVDLWVEEVRSKLVAQGVEMAPLWPRGHRFAVSLTHDVDHISGDVTLAQRWRQVVRDGMQGTRFVKNLAKLALKRSLQAPSTEQTLEKCYAIEKKFGVTASYFFTTWPVSHPSIYDCVYHPNDRCRFLGKESTVGDIMRRLTQEGFDVGLHGSYHSATEQGMLKEQKNKIEEVIASPVYTTRQHWLHWQFPTTPRLQVEAGLLADTTLGYNRNIGFRAGTSLPFFIYDLANKTPLPLLEVPLIIQDGALIGENALELPPHLALERVKGLIDTIRDTQGCATLLFHPDIFLKPGMDTLYSDIISYCLDNNGWVTNLREIQRWWCR